MANTPVRPANLTNPADLAAGIRRALASDPAMRRFLLARVAEDRREALARLPRGDMRLAAAQVGFLLREFMAGYPAASQKEQAARYADHPDYRDEWRP